MNEPRYIELSTHIVQRRQWIADEQQAEWDEYVIMAGIVILGTLLTAILLVVAGCEGNERYTGSVSEKKCRTVTGDKIDTRCYEVKAPQGCRVIQDDGRWQKLECWKEKEALPAPTNLRIITKD